MRYSVTIWVGCAFCGAVPRFAYGLEHHPVIRQSILYRRNAKGASQKDHGIIRCSWEKVGVKSYLSLRGRVGVLRLGNCNIIIISYR